MDSSGERKEKDAHCKGRCVLGPNQVLISRNMAAKNMKKKIHCTAIEEELQFSIAITLDLVSRAFTKFLIRSKSQEKRGKNAKTRSEASGRKFVSQEK